MRSSGRLPYLYVRFPYSNNDLLIWNFQARSVVSIPFEKKRTENTYGASCGGAVVGGQHLSEIKPLTSCVLCSGLCYDAFLKWPRPWKVSRRMDYRLRLSSVLSTCRSPGPFYHLFFHCSNGTSNHVPIVDYRAIKRCPCRPEQRQEPRSWDTYAIAVICMCSSPQYAVPREARRR